MCVSKCVCVLVCMNEHVYRVFYYVHWNRIQISLLIKSQFKGTSIPPEIIRKPKIFCLTLIVERHISIPPENVRKP